MDIINLFRPKKITARTIFSYCLFLVFMSLDFLTTEFNAQGNVGMEGHIILTWWWHVIGHFACFCSNKICEENIMEILKKISKAFLRIALYLVVIAAVFYLTATLVFKYLEKKNTKLVTDAIPEMFPLLIVYPPTNSQPLSIKPIYYKNFNETLIQNRNYTFNIPEGKEAEINKLLKEQSRAFMKPRDFNWESENPWEAHIIVEKSENGKQAIRFFETWDDDRENVGWYEANGTKFTPVN